MTWEMDGELGSLFEDLKIWRFGGLVVWWFVWFLSMVLYDMVLGSRFYGSIVGWVISLIRFFAFSFFRSFVSILLSLMIINLSPLK